MTTPFGITLPIRSSLANHTGAWRAERPEYVDLVPPCSAACPAGQDVRGWLRSTEQDDPATAWRDLVAVNPFPAVTGRVCYHPCETACNRGQLDEAVGIDSVEQFLGDEALAQGWRLPEPGSPTGRRVLVVGGGPAGLTAAYHLRLLGHAVEVRDAGTEPGGMLRTALPTFRLPRDVLAAEVDRLLAWGVPLRSGVTVDDVGAARREGGFDAVFLAVGARLAHHAYVPAGQSARLLDALDLLGSTARGERPRLGRRVLVYGGGNTAMDAARTARRLGADEAVVVYRRTRDRMSADPAELADAELEGVQLRWLTTVADVEQGHVVLERMVLDADGVPRGTGEFDTVDEDTVVLALGQDVDHHLVDADVDIHVVDGTIQVGADLMTGDPGVFAGGDAVTALRSVARAVGHGHRSALAVDAWLRGRPAPVTTAEDVVPFDRLNTWYYSDAPATVRPRLELARRTADFTEVAGGQDRSTAVFEARRCLSCGSCFGCDNCFGVCPDNAVRKVVLDGEATYAIDLDHCKGCGMCVQECPAGAIRMVPEPS